MHKRKKGGRKRGEMDPRDDRERRAEVDKGKKESLWPSRLSRLRNGSASAAASERERIQRRVDEKSVCEGEGK